MILNKIFHISYIIIIVNYIIFRYIVYKNWYNLQIILRYLSINAFIIIYICSNIRSSYLDFDDVKA